MSDYTYTPPESGVYLRAVARLLAKDRRFANVATILERSTCSIQASSTYSRVRWDGLLTTVYLYVPIDDWKNGRS